MYIDPTIIIQTFIEMLGAVPALTCLKNGTTFDGALGPTILLDTDNWLDGDWDGGLELSLST